MQSQFHLLICYLAFESFFAFVAELFVRVCQVVASFHAALEQPSSGSIEAVECKICDAHKTWLTADDPRIEKANEVLAEMGLHVRKLILRPLNSIGCYIFCSSVERLMQLRRHFDSGAMKNALQHVFSILAKTDQMVVISFLTWDLEDYWRNMQQLVELKTHGKSTVFFWHRIVAFK